MSNEMAQWYVIHTYSGYENKVAANIQKMIEMRGLENLIFETRIPTEVLVESEQEADEYLKNAAFEDETESTEDDEDDAGSEKAKKRSKAGGTQAISKLCADKDDNERRDVAHSQKHSRSNRIRRSGKQTGSAYRKGS